MLTHAAGLSRDDDLASLVLERGLSTRAEFEEVWTSTPTSVWRAIQTRALTAGLLAAKRSPFHRARVTCSDERIRADPYAAVLEFPPLEKRTYWDHAAELRLPAYQTQVAHRFHTSGTELGVPTEQPWDEWTYRRSFCESSAFALVAAGAPEGGGAIIGSPSFGAVAGAFVWAAKRLGLTLMAEGSAFSDDAEFPPVLDFARRPEVDTLIATPGAVVSFVQQVKRHGEDPRALGIRRVISGVGNFLTERHLRFIIDELEPDVVIEQGGKNEILHAPGGIRYDRCHPARCCAAGYLHYLPHVSYVVAVDPEALQRGRLEPVGHEARGVLLMSRLSSGREGVVAYVNDAGDFGMTRVAGSSPRTLCPCRNPLPAFRFLGRVGGSVSNRLGDTLFIEEFGQALTDACALARLPRDTAVRIRFQLVLVRSPRWTEHDTLYWVLGAPPEDFERHRAALAALRERFIERWVGYHTYAGPRYAAYMRFGGGVVVDVAALPHAGRDKPRYQLSELVEAAEGQSAREALEAHLRGRLRARVLLGLGGQEPERENRTNGA